MRSFRLWKLVSNLALYAACMLASVAVAFNDVLDWDKVLAGKMLWGRCALLLPPHRIESIASTTTGRSSEMPGGMLNGFPQSWGFFRRHR